MALVLKDRVKETTTTTGTGSFSLAGAVTGYDSFGQIGSGNTTYYAVYLDGGSEWEVGIGTYTSPSTLSRDTILASSASGAKVTFSVGQKTIWCDYPAGKAVYLDASGSISQPIVNISGITGGISTPDFVQFDTTATPTIALGKQRWNTDTGTLSFGIVDGTREVQIGQQMYALVHNAESSTISKGQVVYLFSATGNKASVKLAYNTSDATSAKTFGLVVEDIAAGGTGFICTQGVLDKLNTGSFTDGDTLYLGATAGSITATKPKAPNHLVYVGIVERANNGNGQIYVRVQNGYELDEIHDVQINSPVLNGQTILYDQSTSLWKNANLTAGTGVSVTNGAASVTIANTGVTALSAGTGISVSGSTGSVTVTNTAPDQTVSLTAGTGISVSGTYPSFTVANTGITSVTGTSPVVSSGGSTPAISMPAATSSVNGYLTSTDWTTFNSKLTNPMTTLGDVIYGASSGTATRLAGNTTTNKYFLSQTGTGSASAAPSWSTLPTVLPVLNRSGTTVSVSVGNGVLPVLNRAGGTVNVAIN